MSVKIVPDEFDVKHSCAIRQSLDQMVNVIDLKFDVGIDAIVCLFSLLLFHCLEHLELWKKMSKFQ